MSDEADAPVDSTATDGRRQKGAEMPSATFKKRLATALAAAAVASALAVSGAHAHYGSQSGPSPEVAPPPSLIAASCFSTVEIRSAGISKAVPVLTGASELPPFFRNEYSARFWAS